MMTASLRPSSAAEGLCRHAAGALLALAVQALFVAALVFVSLLAPYAVPFGPFAALLVAYLAYAGVLYAAVRVRAACEARACR